MTDFYKLRRAIRNLKLVCSDTVSNDIIVSDALGKTIRISASYKNKLEQKLSWLCSSSECVV